MEMAAIFVYPEDDHKIKLKEQKLKTFVNNMNPGGFIIRFILYKLETKGTSIQYEECELCMEHIYKT